MIIYNYKNKTLRYINDMITNKIKKPKHLKNIIYFLSCILISIIIPSVTIFPTCFAKKIDDYIDIDSDNLIINQEEHIAQFSGNVKVRFGALKLNTDLILIHYIDHKNKGNISIQGDQIIAKIEIPNKLIAIDDCLDKTIIADSGLYDGQSKTLSLTGNIKANDNNRLLITDKLIYNISTDKIY